MIVLGTFPFAGGNRNIVRINPDGSLDDTFGIHGTVSGLAVVKTDDLDRIYLAGELYTINGALVNSVVRLLPDGDLDATFDTGTGFEGKNYVRSLEILSDGNVAIGGHFNGYNQVEAHGFIILDEHGSIVSTPLIRFGKGSATTAMDYRNDALYLGGRLIRQDYLEVYGTTKIILTPVALPEIPTDLTATVYDAGIFQLQWEDKASNEIAFILERAEDEPLDFVARDTVYANTISVLDPEVVAHKKYFYRLKAVNDEGPSGYSNIASVTWIPAPEAVSLNLTVTEHSETELLLSWQGTVTGHDGFIIERSEKVDLNYHAIDTVSVTTFDYINQVEPEKTYFYKVAAYNVGGKVFSNEIASIISGINDEQASFSVFPVPAKKILFVSVPQENPDGDWRLIDARGHTIVLEGRWNNSATEMDIENIPPGMYVLQYSGKQRNILSARVVISR